MCLSWAIQEKTNLCDLRWEEFSLKPTLLGHRSERPWHHRVRNWISKTGWNGHDLFRCMIFILHENACSQSGGVWPHGGLFAIAKHRSKLDIENELRELYWRRIIFSSSFNKGSTQRFSSCWFNLRFSQYVSFWDYRVGGIEPGGLATHF